MDITETQPSVYNEKESSSSVDTTSETTLNATHVTGAPLPDQQRAVDIKNNHQNKIEAPADYLRVIADCQRDMHSILGLVCDTFNNNVNSSDPSTLSFDRKKSLLLDLKNIVMPYLQISSEKIAESATQLESTPQQQQVSGSSSCVSGAVEPQKQSPTSSETTDFAKTKDSDVEVQSQKSKKRKTSANDDGPMLLSDALQRMKTLVDDLPTYSSSMTTSRKKRLIFSPSSQLQNAENNIGSATGGTNRDKKADDEVFIQSLPKPKNGVEYTALEICSIFSNYFDVNGSSPKNKNKKKNCGIFINYLINNQLVPIKRSALYGLIKRYRQGKPIRENWFHSGRDPLLHKRDMMEFVEEKIKQQQQQQNLPSASSHTDNGNNDTNTDTTVDPETHGDSLIMDNTHEKNEAIGDAASSSLLLSLDENEIQNLIMEKQKAKNDMIVQNYETIRSGEAATNMTAIENLADQKKNSSTSRATMKNYTTEIMNLIKEVNMNSQNQGVGACSKDSTTGNNEEINERREESSTPALQSHIAPLKSNDDNIAEVPDSETILPIGDVGSDEQPDTLNDKNTFV